MPFFSNHKVKLHYYQYGNGPATMLAFHGFGMKGTQFSVLESALGQQYTVFSFDLFFHGQTQLLDSSIQTVRKGLAPNEFSEHILAFLKEKNLQKVAILCYSIGALLALSLVKTITHRLTEVFFIAPDGIQPNKLLQFGSRNLMVNRLFYKLVYSPKTVSFILNNLLRFGYIDDSIHKILLGEFISEETRLTCYNAITYYAKLNFNQDEVADLLNRHQIKTYFYFGIKDKLFPPAIGHHFCKKLKNTHLQILECDHNLVNLHLNALIAEQINSTP